MRKCLHAKVLFFVLALFFSISANAIPAKPGLWRKITLNNGSTVFAELRGDEHGSYLADRQGNAYMPNANGTYDVTTPEEALAEIKSFREDINNLAKTNGLNKAPRKAIGIKTDKSVFQGTKKGIVILAQFQDCKFSTTTPTQFGSADIKALYQKIINQKDLSMSPFQGSVKDYFIDQSRGQFELDFDVVGPVTLSNNRDYYGGGLYQRSGGSYSSVDNDCHAGYMAYEAIQKAESSNLVSNWADYDWDKDGNVDQVFILFAGQGEADGGADYTIWPHEYSLSSAGDDESYYGNYTLYYKNSSGSYKRWSANSFGSLSYNNVTIDTYACSNELATNGSNGTQINGIGTFCHEFSHCMGYPDMYDTSYSYSGCEMASWDLMCAGSYNGSWNNGNSNWSTIDAGYCPAGYTGFERWCAGWLEPKVLTDPAKITNLKPLGGTSGNVNDGGDFYVVYADGSDITGEYYTLENRQWYNWDSSLPWCGLLIGYVDYDSGFWTQNKVNVASTSGHERMTVFEAAGHDYLSLFNYDAYPWKVEYLPKIFSSSASFYNADGATMAGKMNTYLGKYTYNNKKYSYYTQVATSDCDALTSSSSPSAYYYGSNSSSQSFADHEIWNIQRNGSSDATHFLLSDNGRTVNFNYRYPADTKTLDLDQTVTTAQTLDKGYYRTIKSNRGLSSSKWSTIWLPFDMNYRELQAAFGDDVKLASFTGVTTENSKKVLNFETITINGLKAYTPYIIQPSKDVISNSFEYMQINTANADATVSLTTTDGWKFVGTKTYDNVPAGDIFISDNLYYASKGDSKLKAYRAYFVPSPSAAKAMTRAGGDTEIVANIVDNQNLDGVEFNGKSIDPNDSNSPLYDPNLHMDPTGINTIKALTNTSASKDIYNLNGQRVGDASCIKLLQKGIYIVNGKKVVIK
jgi:immune inhibitor A